MELTQPVNNSTKDISFLKVRYGLIVISTTLLLIPIFYQLFSNQSFFTQSYTLSLFMIGFYGYMILLADVIAEICVVTFPALKKLYTQYEERCNQGFFLILTAIIVFSFYYFLGWDAIKEILIAAAIIFLGWIWKRIFPKKDN